jgi:hypothetical protein
MLDRSRVKGVSKIITDRDTTYDTFAHTLLDFSRRVFFLYATKRPRQRRTARSKKLPLI